MTKVKIRITHAESNVGFNIYCNKEKIYVKNKKDALKYFFEEQSKCDYANIELEDETGIFLI